MRAAGFPLRAAAAALACILAVAPAKAGADDGKALSAEVEPLVQAVRAEIERARTELALGEAPPPHFISVAIVETRTLKVTARNGALLESAENRTSQGYLDLRVGSYELDQTNFSSGDPFGAYGAARPFWVGFDHDVPALRRRLWIEMDGAYKAALETLTRKRAFLETRLVADLPADLSRETAVQDLEPRRVDLPDRAAWEERVRALSRIFNGRGEIESSEVGLEVNAAYGVVVNSEGTMVAYPSSFATIEANASTRSEDGARQRAYFQVAARSHRDLPEDAELARRVEALAAELAARRGAPPAAGSRAPALFTGQAAAQLFGQLLADNLGTPRDPLADEGEGGQAFAALRRATTNPLLALHGREILPPAFSVADDPTLPEFQGLALLGAFRLDQQGVPAQRALLVERGRLVGFLNSRTPTKHSAASNGHARLSLFGPPRGAMSNLIVTGEGGLPREEMVGALRELCRRKGTPYGYLIERITPAAEVERDAESYRSFFTELMGGSDQSAVRLADPLLVWRVDAATGERTPVRGASFSGDALELLEGIVEHSLESGAYPYVISEGFLQARVAVGLGSVVCPDVLVEKVRFKEPPPHQEALPFLPNPLRSAGPSGPAEGDGRRDR